MLDPLTHRDRQNGDLDLPEGETTSVRASRREVSDLRYKFGAILGIALAPLLGFTIWQSVQDYRQDQQSREVLLTTTAQLAVDDLTANIDEAFTAMAVLGESFDGGDCKAPFASVLDELDALDHLVLLDREGDLICSPTSDRARSMTYAGANSLDASNPDRLFIRRAGADTGKTPLLVLVHGDFDTGGALQNVFAGGIELSKVDALASARGLPGDSEIAIVASNGAVVYSSADTFPNLPSDATMPGADGDFRFRAKGEDGRTRDVIVSPTQTPGLFTALASRPRSLLSWQLVNPLTSALIPLLAWLFAFGAIWLATDRLILGHLRRLREAALRFARGDDDVRVGTLEDAPDQIQQVGQTFDLMAERIEARESVLREGLEEKEILLREIHHRVKNNLQIIISLLNMQQREMNSPEGREAIEDARNRVGAIALVHRSLYESDDLSDVDIKPFLEQLVRDLYRSMEGRQRGIELGTDLSSAEFDADKAIPLALFTVEAVSNAIKHGVPEGGVIRVAFSENAEGRTLCVQDSGKGCPETTEQGTGLRLMKGFARQLGGEFAMKTTDDGHTVKAVF